MSTPPNSDNPVLHLADLGATQRLAEKLSGLAKIGDVIALAGPIGAGKTTFARFFIAAAGCREEVPSPTFNLVQIYEETRPCIWHFDLYRLQHPDDVLELGMEQAFDEAVTLIEWPESLGDRLPTDRLLLTFRQGGSEGERDVEIDCGDRWLERIKDDEFFQGVVGAGS
ncbi:MAG: tRNA (adenosine(37)-N6)-threonylcarbamoyltransferase complex ATPase subunit type 1 TsaE [Rhodospirillales bacterium]|nr:tRNA (adenosine(37)-N6)-threonylcarbamoyltransferase complex ATPase subunit type 1 TsaE [Rhodospirillales bacterium]